MYNSYTANLNPTLRIKCKIGWEYNPKKKKKKGSIRSSSIIFFLIEPNIKFLEKLIYESNESIETKSCSSKTTTQSNMTETTITGYWRHANTIVTRLKLSSLELSYIFVIHIFFIRIIEMIPYDTGIVLINTGKQVKCIISVYTSHN